MKTVSKIIDFVFDILERFLKILKALFEALKLKIKREPSIFTKDYNKKVLILANGPSVKNIDLDRLLENVDDVVCMNWFALNEELFRKIKPSYYCFADYVFFTKQEDSFSERRNRLYDILLQVDWEMKIMCPCGTRLPIENKNFSYVWVNNNIFYGDKLTKVAHYLYDRNLASCGMSTVALCPLYYFISNNAAKIYIAGVDMSEFKEYVINERNEIYVETKHFYDTKLIRRDGIGGIEIGEFYKLLASYARMLEQFHHVSVYAKYRGVEVANVSVDSFVDVFPKDSSFNKER